MSLGYRLQSAMIVIGICLFLFDPSPIQGQYTKSCRAVVKGRNISSLWGRRMAQPTEVRQTDELASLLATGRDEAETTIEGQIRTRLQDRWRSDSTGLGLLLAAIIVNDARYPSDVAAAASHYYREFLGTATPLLDLAQDDGLSGRALLVIGALKSPLPPLGESQMLRWACDAFAAVRGICADEWSAASAVTDGYPFWPRDALRVMEQAESITTGAAKRQIRELRRDLDKECV